MREPTRARPARFTKDDIPYDVSPELRAIIRGLLGEEISGPLDWDRLEHLAVAHGVEALLHVAWNGPGDPAPPGVLARFSEQRRQNGLRAVLSLRQRDEVLQILTRNGIPCLTLKGAALGRTWYRDLSLRPYIDIDLLVPAGQVTRARSALLREGYWERFRARVDHHEPPLYRTGFPCAIEIHSHLTYLPLQHPLYFEDLVDEALSVGEESHHLQTLGPEDTLLHLCLHLLGHIESSEGWRLRHLWDIVLHLQVFDVDWEIFASRTRSLGVGRACSAVLGMVSLLLCAPIPIDVVDEEAALQLLLYPLPGRIEHHFLGHFLVSLRRGRLRQAGILLLETMQGPDNEAGRTIMPIRPARLFPHLANFVQEAIEEPKSLRRQVSLWMTEARQSGENAAVVRRLLSSQEDQF